MEWGQVKYDCQIGQQMKYSTYPNWCVKDMGHLTATLVGENVHTGLPGYECHINMAVTTVKALF